LNPSASDRSFGKKGMEGMETSLRNAHLWGADTVLLVPAVVSPKVSYFDDAWTRSQQQIRKLLPLAEELKVVIAIEEVWNKFLVSPVDFARYVDGFASPWVRAYLDVGNMVFYGYPQDWIRVMGKRIVKLHIKDFRFRKGQTEWVALRDGDIDWMEIYNALADIGYRGTATVELDGGDAAYLREVSRRFDLILSGAR
jgi:L-ribulose-5-phosphate 3-epimerase